MISLPIDFGKYVINFLIPVDVGCVTFKAAATATAASAAFPPFFKIERPASAANGLSGKVNAFFDSIPC